MESLKTSLLQFLFVILRGSSPQVFHRIAFLKSFAKILGKAPGMQFSRQYFLKNTTDQRQLLSIS